MTQTQQPRVETYNLSASNGRHIRKATLVILEDGTEVRFMERMSKGEAIRQARRQVENPWAEARRSLGIS